MASYNIDFDSDRMIHQHLLKANALTLGALAWRGYLLKSRGAVMVYGLEEIENFEQSLDVEIGYLSKEEAVQKYPQGTEMFQLVEQYNPRQGIVVSFVDTQSSVSKSYYLTLTTPPPKCYALLQERILERMNG